MICEFKEGGDTGAKIIFAPWDKYSGSGTDLNHQILHYYT